MKQSLGTLSCDINTHTRISDLFPDLKPIEAIGAIQIVNLVQEIYWRPPFNQKENQNSTRTAQSLISKLKVTVEPLQCGFCRKTFTSFSKETLHKSGMIHFHTTAFLQVVNYSSRTPWLFLKIGIKIRRTCKIFLFKFLSFVLARKRTQ